MKKVLLGIDYGDRKIGVALSFGSLAEPLVVIKNGEDENALEKLSNLVVKHNVDEIIMGVSENRSAEEAKTFGSLLKQKLGLPVHFQDETLTTRDAQMMAIEAGIGRKRRQGKEDAFAAALILQGYLDDIG